MLSLIRADGTDRRLPSANWLDLVTRPMAVLVSSRENGESGRSATALFILCAAPTVASYSTDIRMKGLLVGKTRRAARA